MLPYEKGIVKRSFDQDVVVLRRKLDQRSKTCSLDGETKNEFESGWLTSPCCSDFVCAPVWIKLFKDLRVEYCRSEEECKRGHLAW